MKTIKLGSKLVLAAAEIATEVTASLGMRGSGKSNGAAVIEAMARLHENFNELLHDLYMQRTHPQP